MICGTNARGEWKVRQAANPAEGHWGNRVFPDRAAWFRAAGRVPPRAQFTKVNSFAKMRAWAYSAQALKGREVVVGRTGS